MGQYFDKDLYAKMATPYLARAMEPTPVRTPVPLRYHPLIDDYTMSSGWAMTPKGRIWLAWFAGGDSENAVVVMAHSDDDGLTFSEPDFYVDAGYTQEGVHYSTVAGNIWVDPNGHLWLFFMQSYGYFDGRGGVWAAECGNPDDEKPVWSVPRRICDGSPLNKPTVLSDGTWILPITLWKWEFAWPEPSKCPYPVNMFPELDDQRKVWFYASQDNGKTWIRRGGFLNERNRSFDEPMFIECKDGSLFTMIRTEDGIGESVSTDDGYTWSTPIDSAQPNATARFCLLKLASGKILLVRHNSPKKPMERDYLTAYISDDDGKSFHGGLLLDERYEVSYPDGFQAPDGRIFIQYDRDRVHGEILGAVFTEDEVEAGKLLHEGSRLKHPLMQGFFKKNNL